MPWIEIAFGLIIVYIIIGVLLGRFLAALTAPTQYDYEMRVVKIMLLWPWYLAYMLCNPKG